MALVQSLRFSIIVGSIVIGLVLPLLWIEYIPHDWWWESLVVVAITSLLWVCLYFQLHPQRYRSIRGWIGFNPLADLVCFFIFTGAAITNPSTIEPYIVVLGIFCARHVGQVKAFLDEFDSLNPMAYRLLPLLVVLPLMIQWVACLWIALGAGTAGIDSDQWVTYVKAVYWAVTTLTTVGYGDIAAKTPVQMLYVCCVQIAGVGVFGYIVSNVAGLIARTDAAREHHMDNLDKIETFIRTHAVPPQVKAKIRAYYHYLWNSKKGYVDGSLIGDLPITIQSELFFHINKGIIEKVPFLRGANQELLSDLMSQLKPRILVPEERIFRAGDLGDALYFIQSGEVAILSHDNKHLATLRDGAFFGEMALVSSSPRTATAKATTFCDVYLLEKHAFQVVIDSYPEFRHHLEEIIKQRKAA